MASSARIDELRKKFDENPRRYFAPLANEYRKAGDLEQAIFICQEYLPQQPGHMSGHIVYGQALFELARLDEARQVFETALSLDPENLIALRHLGDIARQTGDSRTARSWYQRVLEADPRNEEIAQVMMSLLATPAAPQPAVETLAPTPTPTPAPTPLGTPVVSEAPAMGFEPTSLTFEVEKSTDGSDLAVGPELGALPGRQTPASAPPPVEPIAAVPVAPAPVPAAPEHELLDIDDFTIGGVPLMEVGAAPSIDEPSSEEPTSDEESFTEARDAFVSEAIPTPPVALPAFAAPVPELDDLDVMIERSGDPFEADPLAIAAAAPPAEELAADIELGLPDDGASSIASAPESLVTESPALDDMAVLGLETFESGIVVSPTPEPVEIDPPSEFEALFSYPDAREAHISHPDAREASGGPAFSAVSEAAAAADDAVVDHTEPSTVVDDVVVSHPDAGEVEVQPGHPDAREAKFSDPDAREASGGSAFPSFPPTPEPTADIAPPAIGGGESVFDSALLTDPNTFAGFETPIAGVEAQAAPHAELPVPPVAQNPTPIVNPAIEASAYTPPAATAFVTETMAELYLQQGHVEAAIEIYHQLVAQRPDDPALRDRLSVLERQLSHGTTGETSEAAAPAVAGPTIREFLTGLLWPSSSSADAAAPSPEEPITAGFDAASAEGPPSIDEEFGAPIDPVEPVTFADPFAAETVEVSSSAPTPLSTPAVDAFDLSAPTPLSTPAVDAFDFEVPAEPVVEHRSTPVSRGTPAVASETVSGSIDALFSGADASTTDASAASTLAQAFATEGPDAPLRGMPAHTADSELSLDHVFKTGPAPRPSGEMEAFSFDQFFADEMLDGGKGPGSAPAAPGDGDDIEQFNNWLNGLKKT